MRVLFLSSELPHPADSGGAIKTSSILAYLRQRHELHVFCFERRSLTQEQARWCADFDSVETVPLNRGRTPLMLAARCSAPATRTLLDAGAGQQFPDYYGMSALHWAASDGDDETVRLLLEAGADPSVSHGRNSTPLDHAKGRSDAEGKKIAKRLEEAFGTEP